MPQVVQRRSGSITFGDLAGRFKVLRVACRKCDRKGQYSVARLIEIHGADVGLPDWKDKLTVDCPLRAQTAIWNHVRGALPRSRCGCFMTGAIDGGAIVAGDQSAHRFRGNP
jgi:hypothetical protein